MTTAALRRWRASSAAASLARSPATPICSPRQPPNFPPEEWQARGYVLVAAALNAITPAQRERLLPLVRARLAEDRIAVRAMALEAFATLAAHEPGLRDQAMEMLEQHRHSTDPAMRARARMMLPILMRADTRPPR